MMLASTFVFMNVRVRRISRPISVSEPRLVTGMVTVNGTGDSSWKHGMVPVSVRMVTGIEAAVLLSTVLDQKVLRRVKVRRGKIGSYY